MTCHLPLLRCSSDSLPCTPEPSLSLVELEETVRGGQNFKHSALVHSRWWLDSPDRTYRLRPSEGTRICWPSVELDLESTLTELDASAMAVARPRLLLVV